MSETSKSERILRVREKRIRKWEDQAALRAENKRERAKRTPAQQLALLDRRLGKGKGAAKERARLLLLTQTKESPQARKAGAA